MIHWEKTQIQAKQWNLLGACPTQGDIAGWPAAECSPGWGWWVLTSGDVCDLMCLVLLNVQRVFWLSSCLFLLSTQTGLPPFCSFRQQGY